MTNDLHTFIFFYFWIGYINVFGKIQTTKTGFILHNSITVLFIPI